MWSVESKGAGHHGEVRRHGAGSGAPGGQDEVRGGDPGVLQGAIRSEIHAWPVVGELRWSSKLIVCVSRRERQ